MILISEDISPNDNQKGFKFSMSSLMFPSVAKEKVYNKALKNLYEYMGVENIIKRLQDIDKMKLVMFDNEQRRVFEILPKPGIGGSKQFGLKASLTMESILNSKINKYRRQSCKKLGFLLNGDPMNKRMLEMLDANVKIELEQIKEMKEGNLRNNIKV